MAFKIGEWLTFALGLPQTVRPLLSPMLAVSIFH